MAKGDHKRMQNEISSQQDLTRYGYGYKPPTYNTIMGKRMEMTNPGSPGIGGMENLTRNLYDTYGKMGENYNTGVNKSLQSYDDIMQAYRDFQNRDSGAGRAYADLAAGGGVNTDAIRNRAMQGVRAVYANAKRNVDRNRSIQGGFNPGYNTLMGRMAREQSQGLADASTDVEAAIADLISRNKAVGAGGLANLEGMNLGATNAMSNLYGTTPGLANMFGNQFLASQGDLLQGQGLQNQIAQMMMNARAQNANIPGNFSQAMGNIGSVLGLGGRIAGSLIGLGGGGNYVGNDIMGVNNSIYG